MSDDLASAVERVSEAVECECDGERSSRFIADLRLILSALKDAGEALGPMALSANRYDPEPREIIGDGVRLVSIISALDKLTVGDLRRARAILEKLRG